MCVLWGIFNRIHCSEQCTLASNVLSNFQCTQARDHITKRSYAGMFLFLDHYCMGSQKTEKRTQKENTKRAINNTKTSNSDILLHKKGHLPFQQFLIEINQNTRKHALKMMLEIEISRNLMCCVGMLVGISW